MMAPPAFLLILAGIITLMATFALYPGGIPDERQPDECDATDERKG